MGNKKIDLQPKYLDMVKKILKDGLENINAKVFIYGSRAKNSTRRASDIDLAIKFSTSNQPYSILSVLKDEFVESNIPYMVDIIDLDQISPSFYSAIANDLIEIEYK